MKMAEAQGWGCWEVGVLAGGCCSRKEYSWAKSGSRVGGRCASSPSVRRGFSGVPGEGPNLLTDSGSSCFLVKPVCVASWASSAVVPYTDGYQLLPPPAQSSRADIFPAQESLWVQRKS